LAARLYILSQVQRVGVDGAQHFCRPMGLLGIRRARVEIRGFLGLGEARQIPVGLKHREDNRLLPPSLQFPFAVESVHETPDSFGL